MRAARGGSPLPQIPGPTGDPDRVRRASTGRPSFAAALFGDLDGLTQLARRPSPGRAMATAAMDLPQDAWDKSGAAQDTRKAA
jgi:hypothetical protein